MGEHKLFVPNSWLAESMLPRATDFSDQVKFKSRSPAHLLELITGAGTLSFSLCPTWSVIRLHCPFRSVAFARLPLNENLFSASPQISTLCVLVPGLWKLVLFGPVCSMAQLAVAWLKVLFEAVAWLEVLLEAVWSLGVLCICGVWPRVEVPPESMEEGKSCEVLGPLPRNLFF